MKTIQDPESSDKISGVKKVFRLISVFLAIFVGLVIFFAIAKTLFVYQIYSFFMERISASFGIDLALARIFAVFAAVSTLLVLPWIFSFIIFGRKKKQVFLLLVAITALCSLGIYYGTENVFFDRTTGRHAKYYIKTLEGFKFSSTEDFDPKFGVRYRPINEEVIKEYYFWQKTGKVQSIPKVRAGQYFDMITGEPIVWYSERPGGKIKLFPLPGYDPKTGQLLKPITREIAAQRPDELVGPDALDELSYQEAATPKEILKLIKKGEVDLGWYFGVKENAYQLKSGTVSMGQHTGLFGTGPIEDKYILSAEKIIFLPPDYTLLGLCYEMINDDFVHIKDGYILDAKGTKYKPIRYISRDLLSDMSYLSLKRGEKRRVIVVFEHIPLAKIKKGAYGGSNASEYVEFSIQKQ